MAEGAASFAALLAGGSGERWEVARELGSGQPIVLVRFAGGREQEMRVTRDSERASEADVIFIAHSREDAEALLAPGGQDDLSADRLSSIAERCSRASPEAWIAFIEADGGIGGCDVIRVTEDDHEPDLYLWFDADLAPSADFRFVAAARQELPRLVSARIIAGLGKFGEQRRALQLLVALDPRFTRDAADPVIEASVRHRDAALARQVLGRPGQTDLKRMVAPVMLARLDAADDDEYRRLAELLAYLELGDTLADLVARATASDDPHIREVGSDFAA